MSAPDETKEVHNDSEGETHDAGKKSDGSGGIIVLFFFVGLLASLAVGWIVYPAVLYSGKSQPIDFNHQVHNGLVDNGCESCHFFREDGTYAGVPKLAQCVGCHEEAQGETENEAKFVKEYVTPGREVPWLVYSKQPDCVFFSHTAHVKKAGIKCETCHGPVGESTNLREYEENRITGYSRDIWGKNIAGIKKHTYDRMKMDDCDECHQASGVKPSSVQTEKDACFVCHK